MNCCEDIHVSSASTQVAAHSLADLVVGEFNFGSEVLGDESWITRNNLVQPSHRVAHLI